MDRLTESEKRYAFIVTVGTSLNSSKSKFGERNLKQNKSDMNYTQTLESDPYTPNIHFDDVENTIADVTCSIKGAASAKQEHGAELSAMYGKKPKPQKGDHVTLIATRTMEGDFCSEALRNVLEKLGIDCSIIRPKYLGLADDPVFITKGLPEFLNNCYDEIQLKKEAGFTVVLCPNGGYKALIPYVTLAGLLQSMEIRYIYDDSDQAMALPHLPVGPDMAAFDEHLWRIENIRDGDGADPQKIKKDIGSLPDNLRSLFSEQNRMSELGEFLWNIYRVQANMTPLKRATGSKGLLSHLDNDLRAKFMDIIELDHLIWKGDRVPEMVEHASRHHTDLFRIAQKILLPCYEKHGDAFLSSAELFTLLCALLLHDCGHVVGSVSWPAWRSSGKERLFPGEIREFHHILGYMRLRDGCRSNPLDPIYNELKERPSWETLTPTDAWKCYLEAPATAGLYHRQVMPLEIKDTPFTECGFYDSGDGVVPLVSVAVQINGAPIESAKMLRIAALLRFIDSLDVQHSRAGGSTYVKFHLSALEGEIGELAGRIEEFKASKMLSTEELTAVETAVQSSEVNKKTREDRGRLCNQTKACSSKAYLIRSYYELLLAKRFKKLQGEHYAKHLPIMRIVIHNEEQGDKIRFFINIKIDEGLYNEFPSEICGRKMTVDEFRQKCLDELQEEYDKIQDILSHAGLSVTYGDSTT